MDKDTQGKNWKPPPIILSNSGGRSGVLGTCITRGRLIAVALVLLGLLSASLIITVVVQAVNREKPSTPDNNNVNRYCRDRGCLSAATHQLRFMDKTAAADRCTDFYKYACGGWQQSHSIQSFDVERTILGDVVDRRDADIERLLNAPPIRATTDSWEWKVKSYYSECLDDYTRVLDSGKAMIELIQDNTTIDGWFLFDNGAEGASQDYLLKNQTLFEQIAAVHGDFGGNVAFGLRVRFVEENPNEKRLEFFPAGLSMEPNDYLLNDPVSQERLSSYQTYIREVLVLLAQDAVISDANLIDRVDTVSDDVIEIEKALAQILQSSITAGDKLTTMTLKEMSDRYSFDFVELMAHEIADPSLVTGTTAVYVTSPSYFADAIALLSRTADLTHIRMVHNYIRWRLIHTYIEDLSYNYVHVHRIFLNKFFGHALHSTHEDYCTREVIRRFPLAIQRLYTMSSTTHSDTSQTVQKLFNALKDGFKSYINEQAAWMSDAPTKTVAIQKLDALSAAIGYASIASNDTLLDEYYKRFLVAGNSHLENAYGYHRFYGWTMSNSLLNPDQLDHWDLFESRTSRLFDYVAIFNRLFVIASAMNEPLVSNGWPWAMNMGSLGALLAQKLFASIDGPEGRVHSASGSRIPDWWSTATANAYNTSSQCITDYYVNEVKFLAYNISGTQILVQLRGEPFSSTTLRHIGALRAAYATLKYDDQMKSMTMPGTNFTSEQTFFLAYAQTQCYERQEILQYLRTQLGIYDERTALNAALVHMPEFADAFQCTPKEKTCF